MSALDLIEKFNAGISLLSIETVDVKRARDVILDICKLKGYNLLEWCPFRLQMTYACDRATKDNTKRFKNLPSVEAAFNSNAHNLEECDAISLVNRITTEPAQKQSKDYTIPPKSIIMLQMLDRFMDVPLVMSSIMQAGQYNNWGANGIRVIFIGPVLRIPQDVINYVTPISLEKPGEAEIIEILKEVRSTTEDKLSASGIEKEERNRAIKSGWLYNDKFNNVLITALKGLDALYIREILYYAISKYPKEKTIENVITLVAKQKMIAIERSKVLQYIPYEDQPDASMIGGFENFLGFIKQRAIAFTKEAQEQGIDKPKGVALLGLPGTGKSLAAKILGKLLKLPIVVLDIGSLFGSLVGESEARVREALRTIDGIDGCVLFIDEADKAFAGNNSGTSGDSGTSQRVFGSILNWLQEHKSATFVVITLNRADVLPPEFLRAGRFDGLFYTDLPTSQERKDIIQLHFRKRGKEPKFTDKEWDDILVNTDKFVGAELEEVVKRARLAAFNRTKKDATPTAKEVLQCCNEITPMARMDGDRQLSRIREFCKQRAVPVSKEQLSSKGNDSKLLNYIDFGD